MSREHLGAVGLLALLLMGTDVRPLPAPHEPAWAFGRAPARALALGIMTDADDRCQRAVAEYADFRLTSR